MNISLRWLNQYLQPHVSAAEAEAFLTEMGFPLESVTPGAGGDALLDVEVTSNRGDCLSHVGLAREIGACPRARRRFIGPAISDPHHGTQGDPARHLFRLENRAPEVCPRFTAQVVRGVKVGPSPAWLAQALEAVGQRSINNVVDVTNWLAFELGNPAHVFDLRTLAGSALVVRYAQGGERLKTLDGKERTLKADELVVADAERAQSLAGVIGGFDSQVTGTTRDVVLEVACWDPVTVRRAARRHRIRTDASHRFERYVDARTLRDAALRGVNLLLEVAGGSLAPGLLHEGGALPTQAEITLRPSRVKVMLGAEVSVASMIAMLRSLGIDVAQRDEDALVCAPPPWRASDLTREVDLIEEIARLRGLDAVEAQDRVVFSPRATPRQERVKREVRRVLAGLGFYEAVTFSFASREGAAPFVEPGLRTLAVDDARRAHEPVLRPSALAGLLACRRANQDGQVVQPGGVRLFERAAAFAETEAGASRERVTLALLADVPGEGRRRGHDDLQRAVRLVRGAVEALVNAALGPGASVRCLPGEAPCAAWNPDAFAWVEAMPAGVRIGRLGLIARSLQDQHGLEVPLVGAEIDEAALLNLPDVRGSIRPLPAFPSIERDLSPIVLEETRWEAIAALVDRTGLERFEALAFVGCYRGEQAGAGRKSLTLRARFRAPDRTLRHEDVDPQMNALMEALAKELGATFRLA